MTHLDILKLNFFETLKKTLNSYTIIPYLNNLISNKFEVFLAFNLFNLANTKQEQKLTLLLNQKQNELKKNPVKRIKLTDEFEQLTNSLVSNYAWPINRKNASTSLSHRLARLNKSFEIDDTSKRMSDINVSSNSNRSSSFDEEVTTNMEPRESCNSNNLVIKANSFFYEYICIPTLYFIFFDCFTIS